jgi:hypothetical protein
VIDAMAKIPSGILEGKLSWVGAYDMCEAHSVNYTYVNDSQAYEIRQFDGLYCRLDIAVSVSSISTVTTCFTDQ